MNLDEVLRREGGQVLATLVRLTGDIGLAEDALQEAVIVAHSKWTDDQVPDNPAAWLTTAARNKALDRIRREARRTDKEREAVALLDQQLAVEPNEPTDLLRLLFTCCHPALSQEAQIALALRTLCGMTTTEIAAAFLVQDATMGQRISRAKKKIATAQIPYRVPEDHELPDRLPAVLGVLYLVFTTGHHATEGSLDSRVDLADEAIRLCRMLVALMPDEAEARGLLALMLASHARRRARIGGDGSLVLLADQDRSLWDREMVDEAAVLVERSLRQRAAGEYRIQAAIACLHDLAPTYEETDWRQIAELYRMLEAVKPTPVVRVNRAVAEAQVSGPQRGLELLEDVTDLDSWHLFWSTKADFLRRLDRRNAAADAYRRALDCDMNESDRAFLEGRLAETAL
jgi:RNA polymerase sigma-70 factor (ECF subfamily)